MNDMMTFPNTWEEFERVYGITDREEIYTNGARLIPSFRVKQWFDHIAELEKNTEERAETHACDLIKRQDVIDALRTCYDTETISMDNGDEYINYGDAVGEIEQLSSAQPERKKGEWVKKEHWVALPLDCDPMDWDCYDEENHRERKTYWHCSNCGYEGSRDMKPHWNYCPDCGADMRGGQDEVD